MLIRLSFPQDADLAALRNAVGPYRFPALVRGILKTHLEGKKAEIRVSGAVMPASWEGLIAVHVRFREQDRDIQNMVDSLPNRSRSPFVKNLLRSSLPKGFPDAPGNVQTEVFPIKAFSNASNRGTAKKSAQAGIPKDTGLDLGDGNVIDTTIKAECPNGIDEDTICKSKDEHGVSIDTTSSADAVSGNDNDTSSNANSTSGITNVTSISKDLPSGNPIETKADTGRMPGNDIDTRLNEKPSSGIDIGISSASGNDDDTKDNVDSTSGIVIETQTPGQSENGTDNDTNAMADKPSETSNDIEYKEDISHNTITDSAPGKSLPDTKAVDDIPKNGDASIHEFHGEGKVKADTSNQNFTVNNTVLSGNDVKTATTGNSDTEKKEDIAENKDDGQKPQVFTDDIFAILSGMMS